MYIFVTFPKLYVTKFTLTTKTPKLQGLWHTILFSQLLLKSRFISWKVFGKMIDNTQNIQNVKKFFQVWHKYVQMYP